MRLFGKAFTLLAILLTVSVSPVMAQTGITVSNDRADLAFPDSITFRADFESSSEINSVILEYGVEEKTCGTVIAKALPKFSPSRRVAATWTWEMRQSGSLPPGAQIWWRWRVETANDTQLVTETQSITWLDSTHRWQSITGENINLYWYNGNQSFGQELHTAAVNALEMLADETGLVTQQAVDLYIYGDYDDLRDAVLYEPSWTGGMAFPEHSIVIIGISPSNLEWGKTTEAHELVHVLVGNLTFSCLGDVPTWLNEGLAVWGEGGLDPASKTRLDEAIQNDTLFSVRSLSGGFSEIADKADLSYSQSYSVVKFLIDTYGKDKMNQLLLALRDGETIDDALVAIYGFNIEELEDLWRTNIGAQPRDSVPNPTPTSQPTPVPTIQPISGIPNAESGTPSAPQISITPTPLQVELPAPEQPEFDSKNILPFVLLSCCGLLVLGLIGLLIFIFIRKAQNKESNL